MATRTAIAIDLLILDVNDVLYRYDTTRRIEVLAELTGTSSDAVRLAVFESGIEARSDSGELGPAEYLSAISERLGRPVDRTVWTRSLTEATTPMPEAIELVRQVRSRVDTVGLSNNGLLVKEQSAQIYPALEKLGIEFYVSAEFGGQKPAAKVYRGLCERLDVSVGRAAFVDDKRANADGATAAGLHSHRFTTVDALRGFLRDLGLPT
jgi:HAD superfamily hydrolase (TIGR01509 family)